MGDGNARDETTQVGLAPPPPSSVRPERAQRDTQVHTVDFDVGPGTAIGEFRIEAKIGEGAMGTVFSAVHPLIAKHAAIKILNIEHCQDATMIARFVDEARVVNQIGHPNIVDVFAFGEMPDGRSYFAMERLRGETLRQRLRRGPLSLSESARIIRMLARALEAAHDHEVVHRDLKPENVFLVAIPNDEPHVKLLDFGIAKLGHDKARIENADGNELLGTPMYISPEQARQASDVGPMSDVYSLGAIAFELLTGRALFPANSTIAVVTAHLTEMPVRPSSIADDVPDRIDELVLAMLAKDPADRPSLGHIRSVLKLVHGPTDVDAIPQWIMPRSTVVEAPAMIAVRPAAVAGPEPAAPVLAIAPPRAPRVVRGVILFAMILVACAMGAAMYLALPLATVAVGGAMLLALLLLFIVDASNHRRPAPVVLAEPASAAPTPAVVPPVNTMMGIAAPAKAAPRAIEPPSQRRVEPSPPRAPDPAPLTASIDIAMEVELTPRESELVPVPQVPDASPRRPMLYAATISGIPAARRVPTPPKLDALPDAPPVVQPVAPGPARIPNPKRESSPDLPKPEPMTLAPLATAKPAPAKIQPIAMKPATIEPAPAKLSAKSPPAEAVAAADSDKVDLDPGPSGAAPAQVKRAVAVVKGAKRAKPLDTPMELDLGVAGAKEMALEGNSSPAPAIELAPSEAPKREPHVATYLPPVMDIVLDDAKGESKASTGEDASTNRIALPDSPADLARAEVSNIIEPPPPVISRTESSSNLEDLPGEPTAITAMEIPADKLPEDSRVAATPIAGSDDDDESERMEPTSVSAKNKPAAAAAATVIPPVPGRVLAPPLRPTPRPVGPPRLGRYLQLEEIGRGRGGAVFRGRDENSKREVRIEALPPDLDWVAGATQVTSLAKLDHPNLVRVFELIAHAGKPYLVTEPYVGKQLDAHITEHGAYPWLEAVGVMDEVCAGLEYAHGSAVLHRAVCPSAIVLHAKSAKVGGFAIGADPKDAAFGAPEVIKGARSDRRSDVYEIGATLFLSLTGRPPTADPVLENVPPKLQQLVAAMLATHPKDRPTSVTEVRSSFKKLLDF